MFKLTDSPVKPVSELLHANGFTLDEMLHHTELIPFVRRYLFKKNRIIFIFLILNILFFSSWVMLCFMHLFNKSLAYDTLITFVALGIGGSFALAPLHEFLHGVAYRISGAPKVFYKANWRKLYFMAIADKFITGKKAFYFIGLTPFVVISLLLMVFTFEADPKWQVVLMTTLWMHATMCAGDFALLSYFEQHKHREVVTYDDAGNAVSYFYSRKKQPGSFDSKNSQPN